MCAVVRGTFGDVVYVGSLAAASAVVKLRHHEKGAGESGWPGGTDVVTRGVVVTN